MSDTVRNALWAFGLSRLLVVLVIILGSQVKFVPQHTHDGVDVLNPLIQLEFEGVRESLREVWRSGDAYWYLQIANDGYSRADASTASMQNWVFFPLFPILLRVFGVLFGNPLIAGVFIANVSLLLFLVVLGELLRCFGYSRQQCSFGVWTAAVFPVSHFFSSPLTESLFCLFTTSSVLMLQRKQEFGSALLMAAACALRPTGLLLLPGYALLLLLLRETSFLRRGILLMVSASGGVAYMIFLYLICGDALAFSHNQRFWDRSEQSVWVLISELWNKASLVMVGWNFVTFNALCGVFALGAAARFLYLRQWALALFLAVPVCAALSTGTVLSLGRFVMALFPIYVLLAREVTDENTQKAVLCLFSTLLALMTLMYSAHVTAAMA